MTRGETVANETIRKLQAVLKHDRNNAEAHRRPAIAYADKGGLLETVDEFQAALEINPDDAEVRCSLASVYRERNKPDHAASEYERVPAIQLDAVQVQRDLDGEGNGF